MAEATSPGWARLRCETTCTIEFLHRITRELENSPWSCSWEILPDLDEHGGKVTQEIPEMDTESTQDPRLPSPPDRPTPPNPPDRPAKKEERADLELRAFRIQHMATFASVEQLNGKNVGILVHIGCKARPIKNAQPQLLATLQHKISRQPEDSTP